MDRRDAVNRDLLTGLLAVQNGLIEQDVLILAFRAWTQDKSRSIAAILAAQGAIDVDERALLEVLASKHMKRNTDDPEKSLVVLNIGRSVRACIAKIGDPDIEATLGHVGSGSTATNDDDDDERTGSDASATAAGDGQRFRVLRPHARGGLGAVFVALDAELNREVALKQILDHHADDATSRTRFVLEAEITGGLEHPGLVPVYGLVNDGEGRPY
jgi:serine/threonine protein kinase